MISKLSRTSLLVAAILFSNMVLAAPEDINLLKQQIAAKEYKKAFLLADKLTQDMAGEPDFDMLAGIAAFGAEKYQEAVFAFERVVLVEPESFYGRYYLALTYQKLNNLPAAAIELEKLSENLTDDAENVDNKQRVDDLLAVINEQRLEQRRRFSQDVTVMFGVDSNINSGSSLNQLELADGTLIPLFDSSKSTDDSVFYARYHAGYLHPFTQSQSLKFDFGIQQTSYAKNNADYRRQIADFNIRYEFKPTKNTGITLGLNHSPMWYGGEKYSVQNAVSLGWQHIVSRAHTYGFNATLADVDYIIYDTLDLKRYQANAFYRLTGRVQQILIFNTYRDVNKDDLKHNDKKVLGLTYLINFPITRDVIGNLTLMHEQQEYEAPNPLFNEFADADIDLISTKVTYTGLNKQVLEFKISYQEKNLDSDIEAMELYEYNRAEANFTWKYNF